MKKLLLLLLIPGYCFSQGNDLPMDTSTGRISYKEIVPTAGTKSELFNKSKEWFVYNFNSGKDVIQLESQDDGKIIGVGYLKIWSVNAYVDIQFTMTIESKDGKYRYEMTKFYCPGCNNTVEGWFAQYESHMMKMVRNNMANAKSNFIDEVQKTISSLKTHMDKPAAKSDW